MTTPPPVQIPIPAGQVALSFAILAAIVLFGLWAWSRLQAELREEQRLAELWADEVGAGGESVPPSSSVSRGLTGTTGAGDLGDAA